MPANIDYAVYYEAIDSACGQWFADPLDQRTLFGLAEDIMSLDGFPMHYPLHHYLCPALLLSACHKAAGHSAERLGSDLAIARALAAAVLGGFCGYQGACGAAIGVGIFWCVYTDCTPLSGAAWAYGNRATGQALLKMAAYGGPRCCKRCLFLSLESALPDIRQILGLDLAQPDKLRCGFHELNRECLKKNCPYYPKEEG